MANFVFGVVLVIAVCSGGAVAVHHVAGGDQGWDASSDLAAWSIGKSFSVGDTLWFAYSTEEESIVELRSEQEYNSCDITNPIKMYTSGLDRVDLSKDGHRYFSSSRLNGCNNGLKLHIQVDSDNKILEKVPAADFVEAEIGASAPLPSAGHRGVELSLSLILIFSCLIFVWFV